MKIIQVTTNWTFVSYCCIKQLVFSITEKIGIVLMSYFFAISIRGDKIKFRNKKFHESCVTETSHLALHFLVSFNHTFRRSFNATVITLCRCNLLILNESFFESYTHGTQINLIFSTHFTDSTLVQKKIHYLKHYGVNL